jgi:hypothetical protein
MLDYRDKDQENLLIHYLITCPQHPIHQGQPEQQEHQHAQHIVSYTASLKSMMESIVVAWEQEADILTYNDAQPHQLGSMVSKEPIDGAERKASKRTRVT